MPEAAVVVLIMLSLVFSAAHGNENGGPVAGSNMQWNPSAFTGNLLVVPMDGSHWRGVKAIAEEMGRRGHRVTVVIPEISISMGPGKYYNTITYPVPFDKEYVESVMLNPKELMERPPPPILERISRMFTQIGLVSGFIHTTAESLLLNSSIISQLGQQNFDAVLTDPMVPTGSLIARKLGLPTINLLRGIPCSLDYKAAGCPAPPSFVPGFFSSYSDRMSFSERVANYLLAVMEPFLCRLFYWRFDQMAYQFLGEEVGIAEVLSESAVWLLRVDFTFEFPRPIMPNMVLVGGINCEIRNPLPEDLESWISGEHGFVVFTLGTALSEYPDELASVYAEAFRQIPQKVIWRYTGPPPANLSENVKLMKWVPQNDLLAHPGARAFITHAGSHGLFEGLCHAIPMVMIPFGGDQPYNAQKMASRGAGVVLDMNTFTTENVVEALNQVINDTRYKETIQRLSAIHKDRPIDPLNLSVHWTEFVMQHKGAKHLKVAVHNLNLIQYFSLDVLALLATAVIIFVILVFKCFKFCFRKISRKPKEE